MNPLPEKPQEQVDLAVVIVSWNVKDLLKANLDCLAQSQGELKVQVVVVDNASKDDSVKMVHEEYSWVTLIANKDNLGFAKAVNQGIQAAPSRHVLLLNPDMRVEPETLQKIVDYLDLYPDVGVVSGLLKKEDGSVLHSVRRFPDVWSQAAILLKLPHLFKNITKNYLFEDFDYMREQTVDSVRGSLFGINHSVLKQLPGLDERYFIWFEEVDYCKAVHAHGMKVMHAPSIVAHDYVGRSFAQRKRFWKQNQFSRSMLTYFQKWHPGWRAWLIAIIRPFPLAAAWIADKLS